MYATEIQEEEIQKEKGVMKKIEEIMVTIFANLMKYRNLLIQEDQ